MTFDLVWPRRAVLTSTTRLVHSNEDGLFLPCLYFITDMDAEMPHQEDVVQHGDAPLHRLGRSCRLRGEAGRARAILGEDTPWTRLFELAELPTYRLLTVEFLSTFRYRAH
ncbi:hypothetical protein R6Q57_002624 [Mikania cordata]